MAEQRPKKHLNDVVMGIRVWFVRSSRGVKFVLVTGGKKKRFWAKFLSVRHESSRHTASELWSHISLADDLFFQNISGICRIVTAVLWIYFLRNNAFCSFWQQNVQNVALHTSCAPLTGRRCIISHVPSLKLRNSTRFYRFRTVGKKKHVKD